MAIKSGINLAYLFRRYKLKDVFTPSSVAKLTYIPRKEIESKLERYITLPGMQIAIYGNSGSGKSTLVFNMLRKLNIDYIKFSCTETTTFEQLILDAFDRIGAFYTAEKGTKSSKTLSKEMSIRYREIAACRKSTETSESSSLSKRIIPIQLTPQRLAEFLADINCIWIIEDFHKVKEEEKVQLSQVLKVFMDCENGERISKIICIGAVGTARELIQYDKELTNRVAEVSVPLMSMEDLHCIVKKGFEYMNVSGESEELCSKISYYSNGLASVSHQLCYDLCYNNQIKTSGVFHICFDENDFRNAVQSYKEKFSDTFAKYYEMACTIARGKNLLKEMVDRDEEYFDPTVDKDGNKILESKAIEKIKAAAILCTPEYNELLRINTSTRQYTFSSPFFFTFLKIQFALEKAKQVARAKGSLYPIYELEKTESTFVEYFFKMDKSINWQQYLIQERIEDNEQIAEAGSIIRTIENRKNSLRNNNYNAKYSIQNYRTRRKK